MKGMAMATATAMWKHMANREMLGHSHICQTQYSATQTQLSEWGYNREKGRRVAQRIGIIQLYIRRHLRLFLLAILTLALALDFNLLLNNLLFVRFAGHGIRLQTRYPRPG